MERAFEGDKGLIKGGGSVFEKTEMIIAGS